MYGRLRMDESIGAYWGACDLGGNVVRGFTLKQRVEGVDLVSVFLSVILEY